LKDNGEFIQLPNKVFEGLVEKGQITGLLAQTESSLNAEVEEILRKASKRDREEANRRYKAIEPFLNRNSSTKPNRSERRWIASYLRSRKDLPARFHRTPTEPSTEGKLPAKNR
jgi:hypothetical protein